ncbi:MAG: mutarotase [Clostridiaceae bacterium]|nr:mutarotase [Clostridiaceae bacterium]
MSEIKLIYDSLREQADSAIRADELRVDPNLSDKSRDTRRGLTVLLRPAPPVRDAVMNFLAEAAPLEPDQYFYQVDELHTTVLSIITCEADFQLDEIDLAPYIHTIERAAQESSAFAIVYRGVTATPDSVMIQGFPLDEQLEQLRDNIRSSFRESGLFCTIDQRYRMRTAHMTCMRFRTPALNNPERFIELLDHYRSHDFGNSNISEIEFSLNDWYMTASEAKLLRRFSLK